METTITPQEIEPKIIDALRKVYDPEIPVNIFDLGLIYDVRITEACEVVVLMTLTAPNCPEAEFIPANVEFEIKQIPGVTNAKAIVTFDPPWDKSRLSDEAKLELGLF